MNRYISLCLWLGLLYLGLLYLGLLCGFSTQAMGQDGNDAPETPATRTSTTEVDEEIYNDTLRDTFDRESFDLFIKDIMAESKVPGLAVIIFDKEGNVYETAFGKADAEGSAVTLDTPFQLGSVSKSFTALVITQLAAEGRLNLDAPVITYLPDFHLRNKQKSDLITVRHILNHYSGITTLDGNRLQHTQYRGADALQKAVQGLTKTKLHANPGETFAYSNANYIIAGLLIETLTGQSFERALKDRIFTPLNMTQSYVQMPDRDSVKEAVGFRQWFGIPIEHSFVAGRAMAPAGGVTASARDLVRYLRAVAEADPLIIPSNFAVEMSVPQSKVPDFVGEAYALGWMIDTVNTQKTLYHSGLNGGFTARAVFYPETQKGGVVLANISGVLRADVSTVILQKGLGEPLGPIYPVRAQYIMIGSLAAAVVALLIGFIVSTHRFAAHVKRVGQVNIVRRVIPSLILFALAYSLIFIVPNANNITWRGLVVFQPDVWLCLSLCALIAAIWGVTRLIYPQTKRL